MIDPTACSQWGIHPFTGVSGISGCSRRWIFQERARADELRILMMPFAINGTHAFLVQETRHLRNHFPVAADIHRNPVH